MGEERICPPPVSRVTSDYFNMLVTEFIICHFQLPFRYLAMGLVSSYPLSFDCVLQCLLQTLCCGPQGVIQYQLLFDTQSGDLFSATYIYLYIVY